MKRKIFAQTGLMLLMSMSLGLAQSGNRTLQIGSTNVAPGAAVTVPVQLLSLGNENAVAFSLSFDPARLTFGGVALGSGAAGTTMLSVTNQAVNGRVGISVAQSPGQTFTAGTRALARVTFNAGTTTGATTISFGDSPLGREILDAAVNSLTATYSNGVVTIGSGNVPTPTVSLTAPVNGAVFTAPATINLSANASESGGSISKVSFYQGTSLLGNANSNPYVLNWNNVTAGNYSLTAVATDGAGLTATSRVVTVTVNAPAVARSLQVVGTNAASGATVVVPVHLVALGNENAVAFSLSFDATRLVFGNVVLGGGAAGASLLTSTNLTSSGRVGISLAQRPGQSFTAGMVELVRVTFMAGTIPGATALNFGDVPLGREILDAAVNSLMANYTNGTVTITGAVLYSDGDGFTDAQEGIAGTDANDPASYLHIVDVLRNGNDMMVNFTAEAGKVYAVESKDSLTNTNLAWQTRLVMTNSVRGTAQFVDAGAAMTVTNRFYHVVTGPNREVISDPAGFYSLPLNPGANALSVPLHKMAIARGMVVSVNSNTVTLNGNPNLTANSLAPANNFSQYILVALNDATATAGNPGIQGDWWPIVSNTANTVTLNPGADNLAGVLANGTSVAIRKLMSMRDLFGYATTLVLNKDSTFAAVSGDSSKADVIRFVTGTSFGTAIFYHDGSLLPAGYYVGGLGSLDGSTITVLPGQGFMLFRPATVSPASVLVSGGAQVKSLTIYLPAGPSMVGIPFAGSAPVGTSNLKESGWSQDSNFSALGGATSADLFRPITGTSFGTPIFYHNGALAPAGWYQGGTLNNNYSLQPGLAYLFLNNGTSLKKWRQAVPYQ